jgi:putative phosphoesterase
MRLALISDLHGNLVALDAVLAALDQRGVDQIVCLGDVVDLGPRPEETVQRLRQRGIPCVRGNHDTLDEHPAHPRLLELEQWTADVLSDDSCAWLNTLPMSMEIDLDGLKVLAVHGSPLDVRHQLLDSTPRETLESWCDQLRFDVLAAGHTHVQTLRHLDHRVLLNVGSLGMPFLRALGRPPPTMLARSDYAIIEHVNGVTDIALCQLPLDMDRFVASMHASGIPHPEHWLAQWEHPPR